MVIYKIRGIRKLMRYRLHQTYKKLTTACAYIAIPFPSCKVSTTSIFKPTKWFIWENNSQYLSKVYLYQLCIKISVNLDLVIFSRLSAA